MGKSILVSRNGVRWVFLATLSMLVVLFLLQASPDGDLVERFGFWVAWTFLAVLSFLIGAVGGERKQPVASRRPAFLATTTLVIVSVLGVFWLAERSIIYSNWWYSLTVSPYFLLVFPPRD